MRTGWHGVGLDVEGPEELLDEIRGHLPAFYDDAQPVAGHVRVFEEEQKDGGYAIEIDGERPSQFVASYPTLLDLANLIELAVVERLPDLVAVHAGAVALDGHAFVLPGSTQTGKTHLVTALLESGASYLSDEFTLFDEEGRVFAYPRPLAVRDSDSINRVTAQSLGADLTIGPIPVAAVALLTYDKSIDDLQTEELSASETWLGLMEHCITVHRRPEASFAALTRVAASATGVRGRRGDARAALPRLTGLAPRVP